MDEDKCQQTAIEILDRLTMMPFEDCCKLDKALQYLPKKSGIYAIKHQNEGILYIGKSFNIRNRFMGGHKALFYAYADHFPLSDIRVAVVTLSDAQRNQALELEARILQVAQPRYNRVIRKQENQS
jgi:excinuclease UvrABC nuclease subunit